MIPPTLDPFGGMQATHHYWHIGQLVTRRSALGTPRMSGSGNADRACNAAAESRMMALYPG